MSRLRTPTRVAKTNCSRMTTWLSACWMPSHSMITLVWSIRLWRFTLFTCSNISRPGVQIERSHMTLKVAYMPTIWEILGDHQKSLSTQPKIVSTCTETATVTRAGNSVQTVSPAASVTRQWRDSTIQTSTVVPAATNLGATKTTSARFSIANKKGTRLLSSRNNMQSKPKIIFTKTRRSWLNSRGSII